MVAPFATSPDMLRRFWTAWYMYRTFSNLTLTNKCSFIFNKAFYPHFIFFHFRMWLRFFIFQHMSVNFICEWCGMSHHCPLTIISILACPDFSILVRIHLCQQKGSHCHLLYLYSLSQNQQICDLHLHSCDIICWSVFFYSFCCSINHLICGCILHSYCIFPWRNWDWCSFSLLYSLLILCILFLFLIYYFHQAQYFRAKKFLSRDLYRSSWYMLILQETRSVLKSLGKLSNTCTIIPYSCFSYFSLIFLNFNLILYISLKQMSVFLLLP